MKPQQELQHKDRVISDLHKQLQKSNTLVKVLTLGLVVISGILIYNTII